MVKRRSNKYVCVSDHLLYVRIIPSTAQPEISRVEALRLSQDRLRPLDHRPSGRSFENNHYGVLTFEGGSDGKIVSGCQLFKTRELWGFNAYYLSDLYGQRGIPTSCHEAALEAGLRTYLQFARESLGTQLPITVELGASNIAGHVLFMDPRYTNGVKEWGPLYEESVSLRRTVTTGSDEEIDAILLAAFEKIFDAGGRKRPDRYNGFPGDKAGESPRGY